jgi:hypothetical protein
MSFDFEPEDAWHPDDPVRELAHNLGRRIALVDGLPEPRGTSARGVLGAVEHRYRLAVRRRQTPRDLLRLEQIAVDLEYARSQL